MDNRDMNEDDGIEVEVEIETLDSENSGNVEKPSSKKGMGLFAVLGLFSLATIMGAIGGAYGAQYLTTEPDQSVMDAQLNRAMATAEDRANIQIAEMKSELNALKRQVMQIQADQNEAAQIEVTQFSDDKFKALIERIEILENAPPPSLPEIEATTLTALKNAQEDDFSWPDITGVETRLDALEADALSAKTQIETLAEAMITLAETPAPVSALTPEPIYIVTEGGFPKQALLAAAEAQSEKKGFISKALSKHIQVRAPNDPLVLIEAVETALARDDLRTALKSFDALPENIRQSGQKWRDSVEHTLNE